MLNANFKSPAFANCYYDKESSPADKGEKKSPEKGIYLVQAEWSI